MRCKDLCDALKSRRKLHVDSRGKTAGSIKRGRFGHRLMAESSFLCSHFSSFLNPMCPSSNDTRDGRAIREPHSLVALRIWSIPHGTHNLVPLPMRICFRKSHFHSQGISHIKRLRPSNCEWVRCMSSSVCQFLQQSMHSRTMGKTQHVQLHILFSYFNDR